MEHSSAISPGRIEKLLHRLVNIYSPTGKEEEGDGARELVSDFQFKWALIGEPTDLVPCTLGLTPCLSYPKERPSPPARTWHED